MNSREKLSEIPLNRFYRYVLEPQVTFDDDGAMAEGPLALFSGMPQSVLLTMGMDTPLGWMVEAVYSPYDLDNIKLQEVGGLPIYEATFTRPSGRCPLLLLHIRSTHIGSGPRYSGLLIQRCFCAVYVYVKKADFSYGLSCM